ncbi:MAG: 50S ribosomal protein L31e [Candidatus Nanohaloarchaea archaeon]|nr:50S ribosomal protein L31e [Candidatus Nanohaloarchaea archaeon]
MSDTRTISLNKVRSASRKNKAKKAVNEIKQQIAKYTEYSDIRISNNLNERIWDRGAAKPPRKLDVQLIDLEDHVLVDVADKKQKGLEESEAVSEEPEDTEVEENLEEEPEESTEEVEENIPEEVREVLEEGTISEAKEAVKSMNKADFEGLLEFEEKNQNRKGMKKFLRSNMR